MWFCDEPLSVVAGWWSSWFLVLALAHHSYRKSDKQWTDGRESWRRGLDLISCVSPVVPPDLKQTTVWPTVSLEHHHRELYRSRQLSWLIIVLAMTLPYKFVSFKRLSEHSKKQCSIYSSHSILNRSSTLPLTSLKLKQTNWHTYVSQNF